MEIPKIADSYSFRYGLAKGVNHGQLQVSAERMQDF